jgi:hypothetical protein
LLRLERLRRIFRDDLHSMSDAVIAGAMPANLICETGIGVEHRAFDLKSNVLTFDAVAMAQESDSFTRSGTLHRAKSQSAARGLGCAFVSAMSL